MIFDINHMLLVMLVEKKKKKISRRQLAPLRGSLSPFGALSRQGLDPIKPAYIPSRPDGRL